MKYNITKEEFEKKYDEFLNQLHYEESGKFHILKTEKDNREFGILRNKNSIYVKAITDKATKMSISKNQLLNVIFNDDGYIYTSYEPIVLEYIIKNTTNILPTDSIYSEYYNDKINEVFYGLWVSRNEDTNRILETGIWKNKLSNQNRIQNQIEQLSIGDKVFLFQGFEDIKIINSPFINFLPTDYKFLNNTIIHVKAISIGKVVSTNINDAEITVKWNKDYQGSEWYLYFRQDGIWTFDNIPNQKKKQALYNIIFNGEIQDYKWWANNGGFNRSKKEKDTINITYNNKLNTKNIILYGAPGVGKTHNYQRIISMIENGESEKDIFDTITNNTSSKAVEQNDESFQKIKDDKRVEFVTFHQNYSYEDFIEGFRPNESGNIKLEDGIFKNIVNLALEQQDKNFYIVIDEINRGNISKIFGELITLIEEDKRDSYEVTLPYSKDPFKIPSNLYIIATMNSTDKSIATIDIALRRRFTFLKMKPNSNLVEYPEAKELMEKLNKYIKLNINEDYMLGHSYFMKVKNNEDLEFIKEYKIKPLLEEYFYADDDKLAEVLEILK